MNAILYLNPANVSGGISVRPILIITKEVDQRKVTRRASRIALRCDSFFTRIYDDCLSFRVYLRTQASEYNLHLKNCEGIPGQFLLIHPAFLIVLR